MLCNYASPLKTFRQLKALVHDKNSDLKIKSDIGQHSQFLQCFFIYSTAPSAALIIQSAPREIRARVENHHGWIG